jgi:hypothetical protein
MCGVTIRFGRDSERSGFPSRGGSVAVDCGNGVGLAADGVFSLVFGFACPLARERGKRDGSSVDFELNDNNEELAARVETVRELISRSLGLLHGDGLIEMRRRIVRNLSFAQASEKLRLIRSFTARRLRQSTSFQDVVVSGSPPVLIACAMTRD